MSHDRAPSTASSATPATRNLDSALATLLSRRRDRNLLRQLTLPAERSPPAPPTADFSSNDYLSLSAHPAVRAAFLARLQDGSSTSSSVPAYDGPGPARLGATGSRLLDGNSALAESLESRIASFHRAAAGLLFNSAYDANVGLLACVPQPGDAVVYDALVHASVHDGMRLSRVPAERRRAFRHNDVAGLRAVLQGLDGVALLRRGEEEARNVFVVVEGVYSMDGDVAPLKEVVECVEESLPRGNGYVIVDEAHSTGIFGERGRGLVCELGLESRVWARVMGFGKAMGCAGGMLPLIESTSLSGCRRADGIRDRALLRNRSALPHQLRPHLDLYDSHGLPLACEHRCRVRVPRQRAGRAAARPIAQAGSPGTCPASGCLPTPPAPSGVVSG